MLLAEVGDVVELRPDDIEFAGEVPAGYLYVDGIVGDVGAGCCATQLLAEEGVIVVIVTVDSRTGRVLTGPEIITRGWVHAPEAEKLLDEAREVVLAAIEASELAETDKHRLRNTEAQGAIGPRPLRQREDQAAADDPPRRMEV